MEEKFKKFWVKSVNNWITDASYNGKQLKADNPLPTFRKFYFIKSWEDVYWFSKRDGITNIEICKQLLSKAKQ